ncbi:DUF1593 domain-containing protein [Opitutus terrae]|uniref:DUF1593 domain-containing protein n=1 Tax=Opitutus terrae (strain DSM 11246 / JCM 15787 / PB90-1) TaxID=452637 RepID=B1ZN44_OPITP|nr:DUF1593 domain-containing protein [Opitutus terrae]ACB76495.1 protein of unknown function DUF1593 [Opitutus terrae PB90-1]
MAHLIRYRRLSLLCAVCLTLWHPLRSSATESAEGSPPDAALGPRQRLLVLTDIEADPDDSQSLVRLLLYSNQIDFEGLVATTSVHQRDAVHPESIRRILAAYGRVRDQLLRHEPGYPAVEHLQSLVSTGQPQAGLGAVGPGKDSPGSNAIIAALRSLDPRPLWISVWGGVNTLAQALHTIRATASPEEARRLIAKLRVYTISDQDNAGHWIRREFPDLFYIVSPGGYGASIWIAITAPIEGIDNTTISNPWLRQHIQQSHGPLGAAYPDVAYGMEGDTPSFLPLIPNGLSVPDHPEWGSWGGRYELKIPDPATLDLGGFIGIPYEPETRPIWTNAIDAYTPSMPQEFQRATVPSMRTFRDARVTLWRWRDEFQRDFAARMDWTTKPYAEANHPPVPRLAHPDHFTVHSGDIFNLSALGTTDPDGDSLSYLWFHYPEVGGWTEEIKPDVRAPNIYWVPFKAPTVTEPRDAHFILKVTDKGSPPLTRYRRVIVTILPVSP